MWTNLKVAAVDPGQQAVHELAEVLAQQPVGRVGQEGEQVVSEQLARARVGPRQKGREAVQRRRPRVRHRAGGLQCNTKG